MTLAIRSETIPLTDVPWYVRKAAKYELALAVFRQRIAGIVNYMQLEDSANLVTLQMERHVELGEKILESLVACKNNPIVAEAMQDSWRTWIVTSNQIIERAGR